MKILCIISVTRMRTHRRPVAYNRCRRRAQTAHARTIAPSPDHESPALALHTLALPLSPYRAYQTLSPFLVFHLFSSPECCRRHQRACSRRYRAPCGRRTLQRPDKSPNRTLCDIGCHCADRTQNSVCVASTRPTTNHHPAPDPLHFLACTRTAQTAKLLFSTRTATSPTSAATAFFFSLSLYVRCSTHETAYTANSSVDIPTCTRALDAILSALLRTVRSRDTCSSCFARNHCAASVRILGSGAFFALPAACCPPRHPVSVLYQPYPPYQTCYRICNQRVDCSATRAPVSNLQHITCERVA